MARLLFLLAIFIFELRLSQGLNDNDLIEYRTYDAKGSQQIWYKCAALVKVWPYYCREDVYVKKSHPVDECAASCRGVATSCVDEPKLFRFEGKSQTCPDFMNEYPRFCLREIYKAKCCLTCSKIPDDLKKCFDRASLNWPIWGKRFATCEELLQEYPQVCKQSKFAGEGGFCCQACRKSPSKTCSDDPYQTFRFNSLPDRKFNCKLWINIDECHCLEPDVRTSCCEQCQADDSQRMAELHERCKCRDLLNGRNSVTIGSRMFRSCRLMTRLYPRVCSFPTISGEFGSCCKSCTGVDPYCTDNRDYKFHATNARRDFGMKNCFNTPVFLKNSLCCEKGDFYNNCCLHCKKLIQKGRIKC